MSDIYWYIEYGKVLAAYAALLYVWPSVVFRAFLKGKGLTFRFLFCVTVPIVLYNGVILGLGLLHILNVWLVRALFYGAFLLSVGLPAFWRRRGNLGLEKLGDRLLREPWGRKMRMARLWDRGLEKGKEFWRDCRAYRGRWVEYLLLVVLLLFGIAFYSYPALQSHTYGNYDAYTHTEWVLSLRKGEIFPNGIYPQAFHCFIYGMNTLFGVKIYSSILFLAGIHISAFLVALYSLMKELFLCRYTPLFVLTLFLTFDGCMVGVAHDKALLSMTRLAWTLPQEFGWYLVFLCPLLLFWIFREKDIGRKPGRWFQNEKLLLLSAAVGASCATHFYVTIVAFFLCLPVALLHLKKFLPLQRFLPLFCAAWDGLIAGALPMLIAFILGGKPENSLRWGIGTITRDTGAAAEMIVKQEAAVSEKGSGFLASFYEKGYEAIFGGNGFVVVAMVLLIPVLVGCVWVYHQYPRRQKYRRHVPVLSWEPLSGYLFIAAASIVMMFLYAAPFMGLPEILSVDRLFGLLRAMVYAVPWVYVDFILFMAASGRCKKAVRPAAVLICVGIYCFSYFVDFHEYVFWVLKRYEAAANVTAEIMGNFEPGSYKVISMDDEKSQIEDRQSRVQLLDFAQAVDEAEYYSLSTEYLFLFVEKKPLRLGTIQYFTGPDWLGRKSSECKDVRCHRWYPDVVSWDISEEAARHVVSDYGELKWSYYGSYFNLWIRKMLCSKAYYWYQDFSKAHPAETNVYYEDEDFVCYVIHQDPERPLNLIMRG